MVNNQSMLLVPGNDTGVVHPTKRNWGMHIELSKIGATTCFFIQVLAGSIEFEGQGDENDFILLSVSSGEIQLRLHDQSQIIVKEAESLYFRSDTPLGIEWPTNAEVIGIQMPLEVLTEFGVGLSDLVQTGAGGRFLAQPSAEFIKATALNDAPSDAMTSYFVERLLQEMAGSIILSHIGFENEQAPSIGQIHSRAVALMTAKRSDPEFTPESLAAELNISVRQLQRDFKKQNSSVAATLRRLRTDLAVQMLHDRNHDLLTVDQIAKFSGFSSGQQMRSAFKIQALPSPKTVRDSSMN